MAINVAIYIVLYGGLNGSILLGGADPKNVPMVLEYASIIFGMPIASFIIIPLWMLQSSGLMSAKRVESYDRPVSPDIESVGQFYIKLIKGFVGISFVISYSLILYQFFSLQGELNESTLMIVFLDPILIVLFSLPIALIIEMREDKIQVKMEKYLNKLRIDTTPKTIKIE